MQKYKNLIIIGTSHIAIESIKEVESTILKEKPEIIALELDKARFYALTHKIKKIKLSDISKFGIKGFLLNLIGSYIEKKLGEIVKVKPGSEMKRAIYLAKNLNSKIALIDQPVNITLKKLSKSITFKEKVRFISEIIKNIFKKQKIKFDLTKVPDKKLINKLLNKVKEDYPSVYKTLIEERNIIMAKNLYKLMNTNKRIVAVVGAGHEEDILKLIKQYSNV